MTQQTKRLESLVASLIENQLDEPQREELNFLLRDSAECRSRYLALMDVQYGMAQLAADGQKVMLGDVSHSLPHVSTVEKKRIEFVLPWAVAILSLAASILMLVVLRQPASQVNDEASFPLSNVLLTATAGAEFYDEGPMTVGQAVQMENQYVLTAGTIAMLFPTGAEAILEGPSVFTIMADDHLLVSLGRCSVHAPDGAEGFRVDTPQTKVIDLGTRFSVNVDEVGQTDVQVVEGAAEVRHVAEVDSVIATKLIDGQAKRFDAEERLGRDIQFASDAYRRSLPDRVVDYTCDETQPPVETLRNVSVQRAGKIFTYDAKDLIAAKVIHFVADKTAMRVAISDSAEVTKVAELASDRLLTTGLINPGGDIKPLESNPVLRDELKTETALTPGIGFRFDRPVVNGPGPDIVLFDVQSRIDPPAGDGFHVSPLTFSPALRSHSIQRFDINMRSDKAKQVDKFRLPSVSHAEDLLTYNLGSAYDSYFPTLDFYALATGIDLTDLGYSPGEVVDGLFIQDDLKDEHFIDPVFIAGLPF